MQQSNYIPFTYQPAVVIPVSNKPYYLEHLPRALASVVNQTVPPYDIVLVCDGFNHLSKFYELDHITIRYVNIPAPVGVPNAFNIGIASVTATPFVLMMGCDDELESLCIEKTLQTIQSTPDPYDKYFWLNVQYNDSLEPYNLPCGHAIVSKKFWAKIGGYPLEASMACDAALLATLTPDQLVQVAPEPLVKVTRSKYTYTGSRDPRWTPIIEQTNALLAILAQEKRNNDDTQFNSND